MRVDRMSRRTCVRLGDLSEPALLVSGDRTRVQANDAAIELMGDEWKTSSASLIGRIDRRTTRGEWHHEFLPHASSGTAQDLVVHATRSQDGCQLILLEAPTSSDFALSPMLLEVLESINECFFALDGAGQFIHLNSNAARFFGSEREALLGKHALSIGPFEERFSDAYNEAMHQGSAATYDTRSPENDLWIEIRAYPVGGGMACYFTDITERVSFQERISFMAVHDSLTGLPNREFLQEQLIHAVARGKRGRPSALLFMDMDRFKLVNDTVGHAAGDGVLVEFAAVVELCIRDEDMLARFGGDEFALLLEGTGADEALMVCERIQEAVREHEFCYASHTFALGVSIGMTVIDGTLDEDHVMALADSAMYEAKDAGGEQTCYRDPLGRSDALRSE